MKKFQNLMTTSSIILLLILIQFINTQPACYVSCGKQGCLPSNSLLCTSCDTGTILINQRCAVTGFQSQPIRILPPSSQNILTTSFLSSDDANRAQVNCVSSNAGQSGVMNFLNVTRSKTQIYTFRVPQIIINSPHQFVNFKFNALLFNQRNNPSVNVLIIDQNDRRIFDAAIQANQSAFNCRSQPASNGFYAVIRISTQTKSLLFQVSTLQPGDQLGITDIQVFSGNCQLGCASCDGPSANQCLSCSNLLTYNLSQKACVACPTRFYKINFKCYPCPYNCQTCQLNIQLGEPVCTKCEQTIAPNATVPNCIINNYINQSLNSIKFNESLGWKSTEVTGNLITVCGIYSLIGGLPLGLGDSSLIKTYTNLPVHSSLWIKFTLFLIDQITGSIYQAYVSVNGVRVFNISQNIDAALMNTSECGTQRKQYVQVIVIPKIRDSKSNATIQILGLSNYFGIRDFVLGVVNLTTTNNCDQVDNQTRCIRCRNGYSLTPTDSNNLTTICSICPGGYYQVNGSCTLCPIYCKNCVQSGDSVACSSCDEPLKFDSKSGTCNDQTNSLYTVGLSQGWSNSTSQGWQFYPKLQNKGIDTCGQYLILGSTDIKYRQLNMKKTYSNLPQHQGISIHFYFYQIDDFDSISNGQNYHNVFFKINDIIKSYNVSSSGYNICGNQTYDSIQKIVLTDPTHTSGNLTFQIHGNKTKFGISNLLLFMSNCKDCTKNTISYQLETIPLYSAESNPLPTQKGLKSKIIFNQKIQTNKDLKQLFQVKLVDTDSLPNGIILNQIQNNTNKAKGQIPPYQILTAQLYKGRQLRLFQNLIKDQYAKSAVGNLLAPDSAYGFVQGVQNLVKSLKLQTIYSSFSRYDDIYSVVDTSDGSGPKYRSNIKNLTNLFRGISILALFIGLISFFFGLSDKFDDLFVMCQIIFVHIFIQSPWVSATMKLPVGAMNLVQFMAWLPIQGRNALQNAIIPSNHYQRSPIVYQQYWKDITFARAIYHTVIFLVVMLAFFWVIKLISELRKPSISDLIIQQPQPAKLKVRFFQDFYYNLVKNWFVYLDRIMRFTFFTVMWASCLQFIHFFNEPSGFMGWNSALCIFMFVVYVIYPFLGYFYLKNQASFTQNSTFKQKFDGIRIKKSRLLYFIFKYMKWLAIAFIIGQLYKTNPLAALIPLMIIHAADALIILILRPYIDDSGESQKIVSKCTKFYWIYYNISHFIQNILFFILQLIMVIMYGVRSFANKITYLNIGYAVCAFIIIMFINALVRLAWGLIRQFQVSCADKISKQLEIKQMHQQQQDPFDFIQRYRNQANNEAMQAIERDENRRPSIDYKMH